MHSGCRWNEEQDGVQLQAERLPDQSLHTHGSTEEMELLGSWSLGRRPQSVQLHKYCPVLPMMGLYSPLLPISLARAGSKSSIY